MNIEDLKYPIGRFKKKESYTSDEIKANLLSIKMFPNQLLECILNMDISQLDNTYRPDGWTARQVIHHIADSHLNAYSRTRRAITEDTPEVYGYLEQKWAELSDAKSMKIQPSLMIIQGIHSRWADLLKDTSDEILEKRYFHNWYNETFNIKEVLALYAWHGQHHLEHVKLVMKDKGYINVK